MQANPRDNTLTLIALGVLAFILADTTHEALGHGLATLAVGGIPVLLTSSYFSTSGHYSRWIPAGGGIANVILGLLALACTRLARKAAPPLLYFLILLAAFNLLFAAAYPFYSGVALFGDWASVIAGLALACFERLGRLGARSLPCRDHAERAAGTARRRHSVGAGGGYLRGAGGGGLRGRAREVAGFRIPEAGGAHCDLQHGLRAEVSGSLCDAVPADGIRRTG